MRFVSKSVGGWAAIGLRGVCKGIGVSWTPDYVHTSSNTRPSPPTPLPSSSIFHPQTGQWWQDNVRDKTLSYPEVPATSVFNGAAASGELYYTSVGDGVCDAVLNTPDCLEGGNICSQQMLLLQEEDENTTLVNSTNRWAVCLHLAGPSVLSPFRVSSLSCSPFLPLKSASVLPGVL